MASLVHSFTHHSFVHPLTQVLNKCLLSTILYQALSQTLGTRGSMAAPS